MGNISEAVAAMIATLPLRVCKKRDINPRIGQGSPSTDAVLEEVVDGSVRQRHDGIAARKT